MPAASEDVLRQLLAKVAEIGTDVRVIKEEDLPRIEAQVRKTNGRVTDLELSRATERGAALQRAATVEEVRVVRASDIASKAWHKPAAVGVFCTVIGALMAHFLG